MTFSYDSNIIIPLLACDEKIAAKRNELILTGARLTIPPIVDYEIRRGLFYRPSIGKERIYFALRNFHGVGEMTANTWLKAAHIYADLRQKGFTVADGDIFIAAFCIVNDYTLITQNTKDFENIPELNFVNWAN